MGPYSVATYAGENERHLPSPAELGRAISPDFEVRPVPIPADCTDGFLGAYWRPGAYLDPVVRASISAFTALGDEAAAGLEWPREDLASGAWERRRGGLLDLEELDIGYGLVVASLA